MSNSIERARRSLLALAAVAVCVPAYAQDAAPSPARPAVQPAPSQAGVEEIIITSTKREANIQDVPIAVSAFSADDLQSRGVTEFEEIEEVSPSIQVNTSNGVGANSTIRVRGVGTTGNNPGLEAAVGTFIDGVYRSRSGQAFNDLLDIERIEVLRGPQGTLFGKNTSAGAISVVTKKPVLEGQEGFAQLELGNFSDKRVSLTHSAPIVDGVLGYRLSGSWQQRDGYYKNANGPGAWNNRDRFTLRGQLLFEPTDKLDARLILDVSERNESCCPASTLIDGPTSNRVNGFGGQELAAALGLGKDFIDIPLTPPQPTAGNYPFVRKTRQLREVGLNSKPFENVKDEGAQLELNYDLDFAKATSITAFRIYGSQQGQDIDFTSADILNGDHIRDRYKNWSQEIRLAGTAFERLDWLVGFYGYTEHIFNSERLEFGSQAGVFALQSPAAAPALPQGAGYSARWRQNTGGYAFFTNNTIHIFEPLRFTFGVRYSKERKGATGILNQGAIASIDGRPTGYLTLGAPVPVGVNDAVTGNLVPGNAGWCEELSLVPSLAPVRSVLRGFCDNASWKNTKTEREVTGTASLSYAITDDINVYTSYSRGYKAGGFNLDQESVDIVTCGTFAGCTVGLTTYGVGTVIPSALTTTGIIDSSHFKPEFANAYELGVKGVYLDGKARVNVAGFWTNFEDFQLNTFNGLGFTIANVGKVTTKGVELETTLVPTQGFVTTFGVTFADARYDKSNTIIFPITLPNGAVSSVAAANKNLTNAPKWSGSLGLNYEHTLAQTEWVGYLGGNVRYTSKRNTGSNLHPFKVEPHHFFLNMNVGVRSPDGHWDAQLWANNLTNEYENNIIFDSVFQSGSQGAFFNAPRMWGATLKYNFGDRE